jgi:hypothetical protein
MEILVSGGVFTDSIALVFASETTGGLFFPVRVLGIADVEQENYQ